MIKAVIDRPDVIDNRYMMLLFNIQFLNLIVGLIA